MINRASSDLSERCAAILADPQSGSAGERLLDIYTDEYITGLHTVLELDPSCRGGIALATQVDSGMFGIRVCSSSGHSQCSLRTAGKVINVPSATVHGQMWVQLGTTAGRLLFANVNVANEWVDIDDHRGHEPIRGLATSTVVFEEAAITRTVVVDMLSRLQPVLTRSRLLICATVLSAVEHGLSQALDYAAARPMDRGRLIDHQAIRHSLAGVGACTTAASTALLAIAAEGDSNAQDSRSRALSGYLVRVLTNAAVACSQVHGGRGFLNPWPITGLYRDAPGLALALGVMTAPAEPLIGSL